MLCHMCIGFTIFAFGAHLLACFNRLYAVVTMNYNFR